MRGLSRLWLGNLVVVCSRDPPDVCVCGILDSAGCMGAGDVEMALMAEGEIEVAARRPSVTARDQDARLVLCIRGRRFLGAHDLASILARHSRR